jgi:hypothetical protein
MPIAYFFVILIVLLENFIGQSYQFYFNLCKNFTIFDALIPNISEKGGVIRVFG